MIYMGKSHWNAWFRGASICGNPHLWETKERKRCVCMQTSEDPRLMIYMIWFMFGQTNCDTWIETELASPNRFNSQFPSGQAAGHDWPSRPRTSADQSPSPNHWNSPTAKVARIRGNQHSTWRSNRGSFASLWVGEISSGRDKLRTRQVDLTRNVGIWAGESSASTATDNFPLLVSCELFSQVPGMVSKPLAVGVELILERRKNNTVLWFNHQKWWSYCQKGFQQQSYADLAILEIEIEASKMVVLYPAHPFHGEIYHHQWLYSTIWDGLVQKWWMCAFPMTWCSKQGLVRPASELHHLLSGLILIPSHRSNPEWF